MYTRWGSRVHRLRTLRWEYDLLSHNHGNRRISTEASIVTMSAGKSTGFRNILLTPSIQLSRPVAPSQSCETSGHVDQCHTLLIAIEHKEHACCLGSGSPGGRSSRSFVTMRSYTWGCQVPDVVYAPPFHVCRMMMLLLLSPFQAGGVARRLVLPHHTTCVPCGTWVRWAARGRARIRLHGADK